MSRPRGGRINRRSVAECARRSARSAALSRRQIHLVTKRKTAGHSAAAGARASPWRLHAVDAGDHQHGAVEHMERALHLRGEVDVAGRVQQGERRAGMREMRLRGEHGDAPAALEVVRVQRGVPAVHAPHLLQFSAGVQDGLAERGLSRVHVGQNADRPFFHGVSVPCLSGGQRPPTKQYSRIPPEKARAANFPVVRFVGTMMHFCRICRRKGVVAT
jgi:hypothetical protein